MCVCVRNKGHNELQQDGHEHFTDETTHHQIIHAWIEETTLSFFKYTKIRERKREKKKIN